MWEKIKPTFSNVVEGKEYKTCINDEQGLRNIYYTPTHIWV